MIETMKLAQTQEPVKMVSYNCTCGRTMKFESVHGVVAPQRTWVGLTDMEKQMLINKHEGVAWEIANAVEQQIKEKNK